MRGGTATVFPALARQPHAPRESSPRTSAAERELPLDTLADLAGVRRSHLAALLAGERAATAERIAEIAEARAVEAAERSRPPGVRGA